jgi:hypothetical protein
MKNLLRPFLILILSFITTNILAQEIPLSVPIPQILWLSDTTTNTKGIFTTPTALLKKKGFIVYALPDSTNSGYLNYFYLDEKKTPLLKKYVVLFSRDIKK